MINYQRLIVRLIEALNITGLNICKKAKFQRKSFVHRNFPLFLQPVYERARMAELVDALDSKSSDSNIVPVRFRLRVLFENDKTSVIKRLQRFFI